jgi:hypothetical protein
VILAMERHLCTGTRAADGGMDWVLEPEVKILTVGITRVELVSCGCPASSKEEGVMSH